MVVSGGGHRHLPLQGGSGNGVVLVLRCAFVACNACHGSARAGLAALVACPQVREGGKRGQDNHVGPLHLITHSEDGGASQLWQRWQPQPSWATRPVLCNT